MQLTRNKIIGIVFVLLVFLGVGFFLIRNGSQGKSGHVIITNLGSCTKNTTDGTVDDIQTGLYGLVKSANDYNKKSTAKSYHATVRQGSCQNTNRDITDNTTNKIQTIQTNTIIVDIPDAKQSWKLTYDWVAKGTGTVYIDLGTIQPSCLKASELQYGDFNCQSVLNLTNHDTDKVDPILQYMPYSGAGFTMEYEANSQTVSVAFDPTPDIKDIPAFIQNTKSVVIPYWFQKRGLDQSKYKVVYSSDIDSPDDNED